MNAYKLDHLLNVILFEELADWLQPKLVTTHGSDLWWENGVYKKLSEKQRSRVQNQKKLNLKELDLLALLHVSIRNFRELKHSCDIPWELRVLLESVREARNALSHRRGGQNPEPEELLLHALNTRKVLILLSAPQEKIETANEIIRAINDPDTADQERITIDELTDGKLRIFLEKGTTVADKEDLQGSTKEDKQIDTQIIESTDAKKVNKKKHSLGFIDGIKSLELTEGINKIIPAVLKDCKEIDVDSWQMALMVCIGEKEQAFFLKVPNYLSISAKAAADIFKSLESRKHPPIIYVNLLNVEYVNGGLRFPDDPSDNINDYPLIVIQPSHMINVTALTHLEYCQRNYLLNRYSISETNQSMERGALVHNLFEYMLKHPGENKHFIEQCHKNIDKQMPNLTMQHVSPQNFYDDVRPHLNALALGLSEALDFSSIEEIYIERYMINPQLGLKGKIDALIHKNNGNWQALELKTGKSWGDNVKPGHALQVCAYHLLLIQTSIGNLDAPSVVYTGNQALKLRNREEPLHPKTMIKEIPFTVNNAIEIINMRNTLVRVDYTGELLFNESKNKCNGCIKIGNARDCAKLHVLGLSGGKEYPDCLNSLLNTLKIPMAYSKEFKSMNQALLEEFQSIRFEHGQLLQLESEKRIAQGVCLRVNKSEGDMDDGQVTLCFPDGNSSEFREGDPCLLSDGKGPVKGNCIEVYIKDISKSQAIVTFPTSVKKLWFEPVYLDVNAPDTAFERNFAALYSLWGSTYDENPVLEPIRKVLLGEKSALQPNKLVQCYFDSVEPTPNQKQIEAVSFACGLQNVLLIQGPPGTGKTYTLALAVKKIVSEGKTIAIATYTHRAADETISKLADVAPEIKVRKLGRVEAVSAQHIEKCLDKIYKRNDTDCYRTQREEMLEDLKERQEEIKKILSEPCVYVGTTYSWLSGQYDALPAMMTIDRENVLFDYMIVDEASQIITPNLVGVLRLAKQWVLVGDHMQLPPIIKSETQHTLQKTLFEQIANYPQLDESTLIYLDTQHRMPPELAVFIGNEFYDGNLKTGLEKSTRIVRSNHPILQDERCIALINVEQDDGIYYKQSKEEAKWVVNMVKELNENCWPFFDESGKPTIGIIAPYRAQVALLRRDLEKGFKANDKLNPEFWNQVVDTVDRFQGDERDIIIISLCIRPNEDRIPRIYEEKRRINVSLSRAKQKLFVVGHIKGMDLIPGLKEFKVYVESNPQFCSIESKVSDKLNRGNEDF